MKLTTDMHSIFGESQKHYAEQRKSDSKEEHRLYESTYMTF